MKLKTLTFMLAFLAVSAHAETELSLSTSTLRGNDDPAIASSESGLSYRVEGETRKAGSLLRVSVRSDMLDRDYDDIVTSGLTSPPSDARFLGSVSVSREVYAFGIGAYWPLTPDIDVSAEIGGAAFELKQTLGVLELQFPLPTGTQAYGQAVDRQSFGSPFIGAGFTGRHGAVTWKLDATYFTDAGSRPIATPYPQFVQEDEATWIAAELAYAFNDEWSLGLRAESADPYESLGLQLGWSF